MNLKYKPQIWAFLSALLLCALTPSKLAKIDLTLLKKLTSGKSWLSNTEMVQMADHPSHAGVILEHTFLPVRRLERDTPYNRPLSVYNVY